MADTAGIKRLRRALDRDGYRLQIVRGNYPEPGRYLMIHNQTNSVESWTDALDAALGWGQAA